MEEPIGKKSEEPGIVFAPYIPKTIASHLVPVTPLGMPAGLTMDYVFGMDVALDIEESELDKVTRSMREEIGIIQNPQLTIQFEDFELYETEDDEDFLLDP